jgi:5'-deoxynucleotidase YfbR-like HD superfamily hydrolase
MAELSIGLKARTAHVKRWQIVRVAREQNLAEHTFMVMLIAEEASKVIGLHLSNENRLMLIDWAIHHDIIEVVTGDLNTVIKSRIRGKAGKQMIDDIESGICDRYDALKRDTPPLLKAVVKCADLIEAIAFLVNEGVGDHAKRVKIGIEDALVSLIGENSKTWPEYHWDDLLSMPKSITQYQ